jgi:Domain of unknown function (DUF4382)
MDLATRKMVYYGLLGLLIAGSTIAVFRVAPQIVPVQFLAKDGTFAVYFNSIPSDIQSNPGMPNSGLQSITQPITAPTSGVSLFTIVSLYVTVDSVIIHKSGPNDTGWMQISHRPVTINLLKRSSISVLLASDMVPEENVTMIQLHVSNATATVTDPLGNVSVKVVIVSSGTLKIPIDSGTTVKPQMSTSVVADRPHIVIQGNDTIRLTPVLDVDHVSGPN